MNEAKEYFGVNDETADYIHSEKIFCEPTPYAMLQNIIWEEITPGYYKEHHFDWFNITQDVIGQKTANYWLRNIGDKGNSHCYVTEYGTYGQRVTQGGSWDCGIRPAMWITQE